jgi:uncharacterized membrane protein
MATLAAKTWSHDAQAVEIRRIQLSDLTGSLRAGIEDFQAMRGDLLFLGVIYTVVGLLACAAALRYDLIPLLFPLVAGLSLLGPAVASGFYELARRRERGEDVSWRHFFDVRKNPSRAWLAMLTLILTVLFVGWLASAWGLYTITLGATPLTSPGDFLWRLFTTPEGWSLIVAGNLVGFAFAVAVLAISLVSFPMLVDRKVDLLTAVETSFGAVRKNPGPTAVWGLMVAGLLVLGSIPLFVGLALVLPVLGYATWHLYTRLVQR